MFVATTHTSPQGMDLMEVPSYLRELEGVPSNEEIAAFIFDLYSAHVPFPTILTEMQVITTEVAFSVHFRELNIYWSWNLLAANG